MDHPHNFKNCSFCNIFFAIEPIMRELKRDHMRKAHTETGHPNNLNNCSFCNLFSAIEPMMTLVKGDHMRKTHNEIDHPNNLKNCSFCNLFTAIEPMMRELKGDHMRKEHLKTDHPNNLKNCSFCNLFSGIEPMMWELKRDHKRKAHTETDSGVSKGLSEPLKAKPLNSVHPHISEQDVKIEKVTVKQDLQGLFNEVKIENEEFYKANNCDSVQQKNFNVDNNKVDMTKKLNDNMTKSTSDKGEYNDDKINFYYTKYDDDEVDETTFNNDQVTDDILGLLDEKTPFEHLSENSINNIGVMFNDDATLNECAIITAFNNEDTGNKKSNLDIMDSLKDYDGIKDANDFQQVDNKTEVSHEMQINKEIKINKFKQSVVWNHFQIKDGIHFLRECNYCGKVLKSIKGSTTNLRNHIKKKHPIKWNLTFQNKQRRNKPSRRKQSAVWKHFKPYSDEIKGVECNYCGNRVANSNGTTTNMRDHLKRNHPVEWDPTYIAGQSNELNTFTRRKQSLVWDHFKRQSDDKNRVECNYCGTQVASPNGSTSNMRDHLQRKHMEKVKVQLYEEKENIIKLQRSSEIIIQEHFKQKPNPLDGRICNYCGIGISNSSKATSKMTRHLRNKHRTEIKNYFDRKIKEGLELKEDENIAKNTVKANIRNGLKSGPIWDHYMFQPNTKDEGKCKYCDYCGKVSNMVLHLKKHHPSMMEAFSIARKLEQTKTLISPEKRICKYCEKIFSTPNSMKFHVKMVHLKETPYTCEFCGKHIGRKDSFQLHLNTHAEEMPFQCIHCEKRFNKKHRKNVHERTHLGIYNHSCDYCSKQFVSSQRKTDHERIHTGDKPFLCTICGKAFTAKTHLKTHLLIHTGEKPYHCQKCGNNYRHLSSLRDHRCIPLNVDENQSKPSMANSA